MIPHLLRLSKSKVLSAPMVSLQLVSLCTQAQQVASTPPPPLQDDQKITDQISDLQRDAILCGFLERVDSENAVAIFGQFLETQELWVRIESFLVPIYLLSSGLLIWTCLGKSSSA